MQALGIDIGGSGIKGAVVNVTTGELESKRARITTPEGAKPEDVAQVICQIIRKLNWEGIVGCGFPAVVQHGIIFSAANIDKNWVGVNAEELFSGAASMPVYVANDADVAGIAEMRFGIGRDHQKGVILLLTLGTGIGSALFVDGKLVPNTELGHLEIRGKDAEWRASDAARQRKEMSWKKYAKKLQEYLNMVEKLLSPDLIIIGGGISKYSDQYLKYISARATISPAKLLNQAGIVGAAVYASLKA
jgi:polyphosphate glucokinase